MSDLLVSNFHYSKQHNVRELTITKGEFGVVVRAFGMYWAASGSNISQLTIIGP